MLNQTGHIDQIKQLNTGIVYQVIDQHGPISRISLSKQSQLAPASITKITRELIDAHLIKELEFPVLGLRGRPAIGLVVESEGWQFLAIRIENQKINIALNEINARTLAENEYPFQVRNNTEFCESLSSLISQFFESNQQYLERVTAISILSDGILDSHSKIIYRLPNFDINNLHIGEYLTEKIGLPVYLHSSVNALALADHFANSANRVANVIYLQLDKIVNVAVLNHSQILETNTHRPILFGHIQASKNNDRQCYCGGVGCLEALVSMPAIIQQAQALLTDFPLSILNNGLISLESICHGILKEDKLCLFLIDKVAEQLATPLAMMVNIFGTQLILINSPLNSVSTVFFSRLYTYISQQSTPLYHLHLQIEKSKFSIKESETSLIKQSLYDGSLLLQLLQG